MAPADASDRSKHPMRRIILLEEGRDDERG
jgi:hypothetical protein